MTHCPTCAAPLPPGAEFCPRCGADLRVAPQSPPATAPRRAWWIAPLVVAVVAIAALVILLAMPFGGRDERRPARDDEAGTETIAEGAPAPASPAETGTIVDVGQPPPATTTTAPPPIATTTFAPPAIDTTPTMPTPVPKAPPSASTGEISEAEAVAVLRGYVTSRREYDVGPECIGITSAGYRNAGYTLEVQDSCNSVSLGRWRVDSKTREVFRQREDGRYLRP